MCSSPQVFTEDLVVNGKAIGLGTMVKVVGMIQSKYTHTQHIMGNHQVAIEGDEATAKTYVR